MAIEALTVLLGADTVQDLTASLGSHIDQLTHGLLSESLPPVPEGYIDGQTGGYWQDPVSKEWHFIPGAGHYNEKGVYIFDNLFKR